MSETYRTPPPGHSRETQRQNHDTHQRDYNATNALIDASVAASKTFYSEHSHH
jgi:hypothetical protein